MNRAVTVCAFLMAFFALNKTVYSEDAAYGPKTPYADIASDIPEDVREQILGLYSADFEKRWQAAVRLGEMRERALPAVPLLIEMLENSSDKSGSVYYGMTVTPPGKAAEALGRIKDLSSVESLITLLDSENPGTRGDAAYALGGISDIRAVEPLIERLKDESPYVRERAAYALGLIEDKRAVKPLINALEHKSYVRRSISAALGRIGDKEAVKPLVSILDDQDLYVRKSVYNSLEKLGWRPGTREEKLQYLIVAQDRDKLIKVGRLAVEPLIVALDDKSWRIRKTAAVVLGKIGDPRAFDPLINALQDSDINVLESVILALGDLKDRRALEPLIYIILDRRLLALDKTQVSPVIVALGRIDPDWQTGQAAESLINYFISALDDDDFRIRDKAENTLKMITGKKLGKSRESWQNWYEWKNAPNKDVP